MDVFMKKKFFITVILFQSLTYSIPLSINIIEQKIQAKDYVTALIDIQNVQWHVRALQLPALFDLQNQALQALQLPTMQTWQIYLHIFLLCIPIVLLQLLIILLGILFLFSFFMPRFQMYRKNLVISLTVCLLLWFVHHRVLLQCKAFIVKTPAFVYAGPEQTFHKLFELKLGSCVNIIKQKQDMYQISSGWILAKDVKVV